KANAEFAWFRIVPVIPDIRAPPAPVSAPDRPAALPISSGRTDIAPALLLGIDTPLPKPSNTHEPNKETSRTTAARSKLRPAANPPQATTLPGTKIAPAQDQHGRAKAEESAEVRAPAK